MTSVVERGAGWSTWIAAAACVLLAGVNLAWGLGSLMDPWERDVVQMFGGGHLAVAVLAAFAAVVAFRPTVGAALYVRATAIGSALYFAPMLHARHLFSEEVGVLARWSETPISFQPTDVEAVTVLFAATVLLAMGRRGSGGEGTDFAPHRFRRSLLLAATGMASIAVLVAIFAGCAIARGGISFELPMALALGVVAHGMVRLRAWSVPAALVVGVGFGISAFTTQIAAAHVLPAALTPLVLVPLMVAMLRRR